MTATHRPLQTTTRLSVYSVDDHRSDEQASDAQQTKDDEVACTESQPEGQTGSLGRAIFCYFGGMALLLLSVLGPILLLVRATR